MQTHIGPHRVQLWLGSGGDAEVWACEEALTGARIAVKRMQSAVSTGRVGRLVREYQYLRMLAIDGVPRARGLGVDDEGRLFLVMDLIEGVAGGTWADKVGNELKDDRKLIVPRLQRMLVRAARLLDAVHASGLVHGDVKPSCFLVGAGDRVSLVDLGASRPLVVETLTRPIEEPFGTPIYMAVEALKKAPPTVATDVWSLSAAAFKMVTGEHPAGRGTRAELRARWEQLTVDILRERLANDFPELPAAARDVLVQGFAPDPTARPTLAEWALGMSEGALAPEPDERAATNAPAPDEVAGGSDEGESAELIARLVELLTIGGEPLSPRVLAGAMGRSTRRVLATLKRARSRIVRSGTLSWTVTGPLAPLAASDREAAGALAEALADEPIGPARVRALAAAGRADDAVEAAERWVGALAGSGRLVEALPILASVPGQAKRLEARLGLVRARAAIAAPSFDLALDEHLAHAAETEPLFSAALEKARWTLARHFETFHVDSRPSALGIAARARAMGELDAALAAAETALDEARWLRQGEAEADALMLLASLHGARGATALACRLAAEAIDRWPPRTPGIGEAVATLARLRVQSGAWSEARRLLGARAGDAPTVIDRAHMLLVLAELEVQLEHDAVVDDALAAVESSLRGSGPAPRSIEARLLATRLAVPGRVGLAERADEAERALASATESGLALYVPLIGDALAGACVALEDLERASAAAAIAHDAALFMRDLPGQLAAWCASARIERATGGAVEPPTALLVAAAEAGLWPAMMRLALVRGEDANAWLAAKRIMPNLDLADANALALLPWAVAAGNA